MNKVAEAVATLTKALREDADFYEGYKANIAMAFYDEACGRLIDDHDTLHEIANAGATRFLQSWIRTEAK